jgi:hypothetical protein
MSARGVASDAMHEAAPWLEKMARFGYAAKGLVYLLVGGLALAAALGTGGQTTGSTGALVWISDSVLGRVLLAAIAIGLVGYVIWGLIRALANPEHDGGAKRFYHGTVAVVYTLLAIEAVRMILNGGATGGQGSDDTAHWSATLMQQPFGQWFLGAIGVGVALFGVQQLINAWRVDLDDRLALGSMSATARTWAVRTGRLGLAARGVVFAIIGAYVVIAAVESQPSEARGLDGVLDMMAQTPWLLGLIAVGLAAYGIYNLVRARYRVIRPS